MPVPTPSTESPQRRLLRDVVYDSIRAEILRGQLEPGERLNDDELTAWLGVSRTPVREAIARLASEGLIEMEANRYTRVAVRSADAYRRAAEYMHMVRGFILEHLHRVDGEHLRAVQEAMRALLPQLREHDRSAQVEFNEQFGALAAMVDNPLVTEAERHVRGQAQFHLAHPDSEIHWSNIIGHAEALVGA